MLNSQKNISLVSEGEFANIIVDADTDTILLNGLIINTKVIDGVANIFVDSGVGSVVRIV